MQQRGNCKACGAELLFAINENGQTIPLDRAAPVYHVTLGGSFAKARRAASSYVSHFCTCTDPARFSSAKKKDEPLPLFAKEG